MNDNIDRVNRKPHLCNPEPHPLGEVPWMSLWPVLAINCCLTRPDISLSRLDKGWTLEDLPEQVKDDENRNANIRSDEVVDCPIALGEDVPTIEEDDDGEEAQGKNREVWLERRTERHVLLLYTLCLQRSAETDRGYADRNPSPQVGNGCQVQEPTKDLCRAGADSQVAEEREDRSEANGHPW